MKQHAIALAASLAAGLAASLTTVSAAPAAAQPTFASSGDAGFDAWRDSFAQRALDSGRDPAVVERVLSGLTPDPQVIELDRNQPEFVRPPWDYVERVVSPSRIADGARRRGELKDLFARVEAAYGVDADVVAGVWGVETNFGTYPLRHDAARSLATLAFEGRRRAQFELYLLALLEMVERGYAGPAELKSSWAGAMGQPQFLPDVYLRYAADFDGDGRRDIWGNPADVFASIANYLKERGWESGAPVLAEVRLPDGFDYSLADEIARPINFWAALGVGPIAGGGFDAEAQALSAELWLPAGRFGPALLLYPNFQVIKTYNPSDRYALAVALLARGFEGRPQLQTPWPKQVGYLAKDDILDLQTRLNQAGHPAGVPDGMFGANTRRAIRSFQLQRGLPADGYPTPELLAAVRGVTGGGPAPALASAAEVAQPTTGASASSTVASSAELKPRPTRSRLLKYAEVKTLQRLLGRLGYAVGKIDGDPGPRTRAGVRWLEERLGYRPTGRVDAFILAQARREASYGR